MNCLNFWIVTVHFVILVWWGTLTYWNSCNLYKIVLLSIKAPIIGRALYAVYLKKPLYIYTYIHIHTHIHTYIHIHIHTCIYTSHMHYAHVLCIWYAYCICLHQKLYFNNCISSKSEVWVKVKLIKFNLCIRMLYT